jgi:hypothetical protein
MRYLLTTMLALLLCGQAASAQSLGELARKERERRAKQQQQGVTVTTDELKRGKLDLSPPLDPARKDDLNYLLEQLAHPKTNPDLLAALVPHQEQAAPRIVSLLGSTDPLKRVSPAAALIVLGNSEGVASMASLLAEATEAASSAAEGDEENPDEAFRQRMESAREADHALNVTKFGVWRFTEASDLTPEQVVERLRKGPPIEIVGGVDNGQRVFNRAMRSDDPNLRRGAIALIRVATAGEDYGFQADKPAAENETAIQAITTFLATQRSTVMARIGSRPEPPAKK